VPVPAARRRGPKQAELELFDEVSGTKVDKNALVNEIRTHVSQWRDLPPSQWGVTPETQRLLLHWRDPYRARRLFFCQREAIETLIYLTEVAPNRFKKQIAEANAKANPGLNAHMMAIYFMHYNFVRIHQTLKVTPAMAAGVTKHLWEMSDIVDVLEAWEAAKPLT
jgi:hypothetical protein